MNKMLSYYVSLFHRKVVWGTLVGGLILGILAIGLVRFIGLPQPVHYHANFAVFINDQREQFSGPQYYQEIAACDEHASPLGRVHMHDQNNHLIHVHDKVVTWSDLFTNLGWSLNDSMIYNGKTAYVDGQGGSLTFILNGRVTRSIADEIIGDQDRLLISYGSDSQAALSSQFSQVESDAKKADTTTDPSTCQGPETENVWARLRQALWF